MEKMDKQKEDRHIRTLRGDVVSTAMKDTAVVRVVRIVVHPKYKKRMRRTKRYLVHDPNGQARVGQRVSFRACRPISKRKRWIVWRTS